MENEHEILTNLIQDISHLPVINRFGANPDFDKWKRKVLRNLGNIFGENSDQLNDFKKIRFLYIGSRLMDGLEVPMDKITYNNGLINAKSLLESFIEEINETKIQPISKIENIFSFDMLLHPIIKEKCFQLYKNAHYRESISNAIIAVFDLIRSKTNTKEDGEKLISKVFSIEHPLMILSELDSDSGQNVQKGFMQIFKGAYQGIRNPTAHSLNHELTQLESAQYLVFASLLIRKVDEAKIA